MTKRRAHGAIERLKAEFDVLHQTMAALDSMGVRLPRLLSSGQDQIFVLDPEQRIVAFFGHWPQESPRRPQDLLGKRKRDLFSPDVAAVHEAAGLRALHGEEATYEWSITDVPAPVYLLTAASPLRNDLGEVAGVLLVTRNVTRLKQAQLEMEKALQQKTSQLLEVERGMRKVAAAFEQSTRGVEPDEHVRAPYARVPVETGASSPDLARHEVSGCGQLRRRSASASKPYAAM